MKMKENFSDHEYVRKSVDPDTFRTHVSMVFNRKRPLSLYDHERLRLFLAG